MQKNTDVYEVTSILLTDERGGGVIYVGYMHINKDGGAKAAHRHRIDKYLVGHVSLRDALFG